MLHTISVIILIILRVQPYLADRKIEYKIQEELPNDTFVGNILKTANIDSQNQRGKCKIVDGTGKSLFAFRNNSCELRTHGLIDRERVCNSIIKCELELSVVYVTIGTWLTVSIIILDTNDKWPTFPTPYKNLRVKEDVEIGTTINLPIAVDLDSGKYGNVSYQLIPDLRWFVLKQTFEPNGISLKVRDHLDYEDEMNRNITATLNACDRGTPKYCNNLKLHILVQDINDNSPRCIREKIELKISEDKEIGSLLTTIQAEDADKGGINGKIQYKILPESSTKYYTYFQVNQLTGQLYLQRSLKSIQATSKIILKVEARDMNGQKYKSKSTTCNVIINKIDVNDNSPVIKIVSINPGRLEIHENKDKGYRIGLIKASDLDKNQNGFVTCYLNNSFSKQNANIDPSDYLRLNFLKRPISSSGLAVRQTKQRVEYTLTSERSMDREKISMIKTKVVCKDKGSPNQKTTERTITVHILDVNEHSPIIKIDKTSTSIFENSPFNTTLFEVSATDEDSTAQLKFFIIPIDTDTPDSIGSNYQSRSSVKKKLPFQIMQHESGGSARIVVAKGVELDREAQSSWKLIIRVSDRLKDDINNRNYRANNQNEVQVTIQVKDRNDNAPVLLEPRLFQVMENDEDTRANTNKFQRQRKYRIGQLNAEDRDEEGTLAKKVEFKLEKVEENVTINVNQTTGEIHALDPIDREVYSHLHIHLILYDLGSPRLSNRELVTVSIVDENDNSPQWVYPIPKEIGRGEVHFNYTVDYDSDYDALERQKNGMKKPQQKLLKQVRAVDKDTPKNANITYRIIAVTRNHIPFSITAVNERKNSNDKRKGQKNQEYGLFSIDPVTGYISCASYGIKHGIYALKLQASDNGRPERLSRITTFYINVKPPYNDLLLASQLSITLIAILSSVVLIISFSLLTAILIVRKNRYPPTQQPNQQPPQIIGFHDDKLSLYHQQQQQIQNSANLLDNNQVYIQPATNQIYSTLLSNGGGSGSQSRLLGTPTAVTTVIGETLLPPPGPKDVLQPQQVNSYTLMRVRRPQHLANQNTAIDLDVASADSGRGASEEEGLNSGLHHSYNVHQGRNDGRSKQQKVYLTMPAVTMGYCNYDTSTLLLGNNPANNQFVMNQQPPTNIHENTTYDLDTNNISLTTNTNGNSDHSNGYLNGNYSNMSDISGNYDQQYQNTDSAGAMVTMDSSNNIHGNDSSDIVLLPKLDSPILDKSNHKSNIDSISSFKPKTSSYMSSNC